MSKSINSIVLLLIFCTFCNLQLRSQTDTLRTGKLYKVNFGNDYELDGKVLKQDSIFLFIESEGTTYKIRKGEIKKSKQMANEFKSDYSFHEEHSNNLFLNASSGLTIFGGKTGLNISGGLTYLGNHVGGRTNISLRIFKGENFGNSYSGGGLTVYSINQSILLGKLNSRIIFYGLANVEIAIAHNSESSTTFYDSYSNQYYANTYKGSSEFVYGLNIGVGVGFNISKRILVYSEATTPVLLGAGGVFLPIPPFSVITDLKVGLSYKFF